METVLVMLRGGGHKTFRGSFYMIAGSVSHIKREVQKVSNF